MPEDNKRLREKLVEVYAEITHVEKRGTNTFHKYTYVRAADIAHAIRNALYSRGIYAQTNFELVRSYTVPRQKTDDSPMQAVDMKCTIVLWDSKTDESLAVTGFGSGTDAGDKAIYKAQTGALKYAARYAFLVPDETDPEADESTDRETLAVPKTSSSKNPASPGKSKPSGPAPLRPPAATPAQMETAVATPDPASSKNSAPRGANLPTVEEFAAYRQRGKDFCTNLRLWGMEGDIPVKLTKYFKKVAGVKELNEISKTQWESIWDAVSILVENQRIVSVIEDALAH